MNRMRSLADVAVLGALPRRSTAALTLLEMMVAVTLLAIIMIGLLTMFQHTQRALHVAVTQSDVFENIRGAIQLVSRDLTEMAAYDDTVTPNAVFTRFDSPVGNGTLVLPSGINLSLHLNEAFWLTRVNDQWQGTGYYVSEDPVTHTNVGVGTLYRFVQTASRASVPALLPNFNSLTTTNHRVSDGIVHFSMEVVYITTNALGTNFVRESSPRFTNALPAFVDLEIGVLEPATLKQFQALRSIDTKVARDFLLKHEGKIHFFRERVPIRNFINPYRSNEVP